MTLRRLVTRDRFGVGIGGASFVATVLAILAGIVPVSAIV